MESLRDRIKRHEGLCQFPKPDAKGWWVIGFGHDLTEQQAQDYVQGVTDDEAEDLLDADIARATAQLQQYFPWAIELDQVRQNVLIEMIFQMGFTGVQAFHRTLSAIRSGDYPLAASRMLMSLWHTQTPARCEELANLMRNGDTAIGA